MEAFKYIRVSQSFFSFQLFTIWSVALIGLLAVGLGVARPIFRGNQNTNLNNFGNFLENIASVNQDQTRDLQNYLGDIQNQHNQLNQHLGQTAEVRIYL